MRGHYGGVRHADGEDSGTQTESRSRSMVRSGLKYENISVGKLVTLQIWFTEYALNQADLPATILR